MNHTKLEDKLEGANNFRAWKYRISLILEEIVIEEVPKPEGDEVKASYK